MPIFFATVRSETPSKPFSSKSRRAVRKMRSRVSTYTVYTSAAIYARGRTFAVWRTVREGCAKDIRETDHGWTGGRQDRAGDGRRAGAGRGGGAHAGARRRAGGGDRRQYRGREEGGGIAQRAAQALGHRRQAGRHTGSGLAARA